jgi:hypothetical protein
MSPYKFAPGDRFTNKKNNKTGIVLRIASLDEFGADFYFAERNYVVVFDDDCFNPNATYNFLNFNTSPTSYNFLNFNTSPTSYNYVMTEDDMIEEPMVSSGALAHHVEPPV